MVYGNPLFAIFSGLVTRIYEEICSR